LRFQNTGSYGRKYLAEHFQVMMNPYRKTLFLILLLLLSGRLYAETNEQIIRLGAGQPAIIKLQSNPDSMRGTRQKCFWVKAAPYGVLVAAGGLLFPLDKKINRQFYKGSWRSHSADQLFKVIRQFGMAAPFAITVPLLGGYGLIYKNQKSLYMAGELAGGIVMAGAATEAFKLAFGRERPYQTVSPSNFFKGGSSFYSGHAITAWTFATVISKNYPRQDLGFIGIHGRLPILPVLMYSAASLVCVQRLYSHSHWASDVYYGALAGYGAGSLSIYLADIYRSGRLRVAISEPGIIEFSYFF
jgi:membrane-associated phospholipid phosphatase